MGAQIRRTVGEGLKEIGIHIYDSVQASGPVQGRKGLQGGVHPSGIQKTGRILKAAVEQGKLGRVPYGSQVPDHILQRMGGYPGPGVKQAVCVQAEIDPIQPGGVLSQKIGVVRLGKKGDFESELIAAHASSLSEAAVEDQRELNEVPGV
jgi:hypothetical protein